MKKSNYTTQFQLGLIICSIFLLLGFLSECRAQSYDSLKARILALEEGQAKVKLNLERAHKQFKFGTMIQAAGVIVGSAYFIKREADDLSTIGNDTGRDETLILIGGIMVTVGTVIQIDSHKFIGRGGK